LSKMDVLLDNDLLPKGFSLNFPRSRKGYVDLDDIQSMNSEMQALLAQLCGHEFIQHVRMNFRNFSFFGFSALGCNPHGSKKIEKLQPHRVEQPFVWLLWKNGLVGSKDSKWETAKVGGRIIKRDVQKWLKKNKWLG
jgi:hypothetical protein